jgi:hypothetical protein
VPGHEEHRAFELVVAERRPKRLEDRQRLGRDLGGIEFEEHFEIDRRQIVLLDHLGDLLPLLDGDLPCLLPLQALHKVGLARLTLGLRGIERAELHLGLKRVDDLGGRRVLGGCRRQLRGAAHQEGGGEDGNTTGSLRRHGLVSLRFPLKFSRNLSSSKLSDFTPLRRGQIAVRQAARRRRRGR